MSAIRHALSRLNRSLGQLESSVHTLEKSLAGEQRDMFALPGAAPESGVAPRVIAQRLDKAIAHVEKVLEEG